jgi:hypothetical protein
MTDWQAKEQLRVEKIKAERAAVLGLKDVLTSACVEANLRPGSKNSFNLPAETNTLVLSLFKQFRDKGSTAGRGSWSCGRVSTRELIGFDVCYYGKEAEKFYVTPVSAEEHKQQSEAVYSAIEKQLSKEAL